VKAVDASHFPALFFSQVERRGENVALRYKDCGIWKRVSWKDYGQKVMEVAAGLISFGMEPGDCVAILGENCPEWLFCRLGTMSAGGASCGVYPTSASEQVAYVVGHSESRILFVENEEQVDKVLEIIDDIDIAKVVIWDSKGLWGFSHPRLISFEEFLSLGKAYLNENPDAVSERMTAIDPDDTAMIVYTSGTTGRPKGAMISHINILSVADALQGSNPADETDEFFSYLPLAHILENMLSLFQTVLVGATVNFVEHMETMNINLKEVSPTIFPGVPRIWEKFSSMIEIRMSDSTYLRRALYKLAVKVGLRYVRTRKKSFKQFKWGLVYWPLYWLILYPLKRNLGLERVRLAISGGAPASTELFRYYNALGIPLQEGYGQTETTGAIANQCRGRIRMGYVGEPIPGIKVRIAKDGEILVKGPGVFKGYFKDPQLTARTIRDGWLYTGDVGVLEDGHLKILDRKKDIIITSGGKNITPAFIENKLKFSHYIQDAVVVGDGRKYLTALILIDEDNVTKYAQDKRIPFTTFSDLTQNTDIQKLIDREVAMVNKTLSRVESIKKFSLLPRRFYEEDGDVTPTKKVKRRLLEKRYADLINAMY